MSRRVSLPGAAELFRVTGESAGGGTAETPVERGDADPPAPDAPGGEPAVRDAALDQPRSGFAAPTTLREAPADAAGAAGAQRGAARSAGEDDEWAPAERSVRRRARTRERRPTGRERHDEKITVYCSPEELLDLEHARLTLRGDFGLAVDRGRIVREAMAVVLADLDAKGESSILVRRLRGRA